MMKIAGSKRLDNLQSGMTVDYQKGEVGLMVAVNGCLFIQPIENDKDKPCLMLAALLEACEKKE